MTARESLLTATLLALLLGGVLAAPAAAQRLNENCIVSVLNRNVQVNADGTWVLPNVPAGFGQVRARATCVDNGVTKSGESEFFTIRANRMNAIPPIVMGATTPIPSSLTITAPATALPSVGATVQLVVTGTYADAPAADLTAAAKGTSYTTSNPAIASVSADGLVTAAASGTVVIQAINDGAAGIITVRVVLSGADSDGDGIPDAAEVELGLDPANPVDAQEDFDRDNLTNLQEFTLGTALLKADTDGDGLSDGDEANLHKSSPLVADTDGDSIPDGVEVQTGTNPLDPNSFDLSKALRSIEVTPASFTLIVNTIVGEASRQLTVTGRLIDGKTAINLTPRSRGTNYASSNLAVANFGGADGLVFAGGNGTATVSVTNSGFSAAVRVTVGSFAPTALSFVTIPGYANNVDVSGNVAYVAAGSAGLQVVDVTDRRAPFVIGSFNTPGNANDVRVVGGRAYVADGASGLQIIDVGTPSSPTLLGSFDTPGTASDVLVVGGRAYVADGASGLQIIDVDDPQAPKLLGALDTPGTARGVDVSGSVAVIADGGSLRTVNVSNPASPAALGSLTTTDARDVAVEGGRAYLADYTGSLRVIDISTPAAPRLLASTPQSLGGILTDVVKTREFVLASDVFFVNGVPIVNVANPSAPSVRTRLNFPARDDNGTGIAVDATYVYMTGDQSIQENGVTGNSRLYIGQYLAVEDQAGVPPAVAITAPAAGGTVIEGTTVTVSVNATDDVQVGSVDFLVNGQVAFTDAVAPYQHTLTVPAGNPVLTLGASAADLAGNVGVAASVVLNVIPDPKTTVVGRVLDQAGLPVAGANVTTNGQLAAVTGGDGTFSIAGVPTIAGDIVVKASAVAGGVPLEGRSASVPPVPAGSTQVGDIGLVPAGQKVGYYDLGFDGGSGTQIAPITAAGLEPVNIGRIATADLSAVQILFVQNGNNGSYAFNYRNNIQKVFDFVNNGGVLIFHDRHVDAAETVLPGVAGNILRDFADDANINILDNTTKVTNGPGGVLTNASLDGGDSSSHGYVVAGSIPAGGVGILSRGNPAELVTYAYPYGRGWVVFSTIPLDYYLSGSGPAPTASNMRNIYSPNVLAYARDLRFR